MYNVCIHWFGERESIRVGHGDELQRWEMIDTPSIIISLYISLCIGWLPVTKFDLQSQEFISAKKLNFWRLVAPAVTYVHLFTKVKRYLFIVGVAF